MTQPFTAPVGAVLFDLDGTLLDTLDDLVAAANRALSDEGLPLCSADQMRPYVSGGARRMLGFWLQQGSSEAVTADRFERLIERMMDYYEAHPAGATRFFSGMESVLDELDRRELPWGIVTNKRSRFTTAVLKALDLLERTPCIISGDTTPYSKPHPLPLLTAAERLTVAPKDCLYIGDAPHDIEAGRRAGMRTLMAGYGYLSPGTPADDFGSDGLLEQPRDLLAWLGASGG